MLSSSEGRRPRIFSGSSHPELAQEIASYLGLEVSPCRIVRFSNDNLYVQLLESVREGEVFTAPLLPSRSTSGLLLLLMPPAAPGAPINAALLLLLDKDEPRYPSPPLVADLLATAGADHVMTMTAPPQVHGFFDVPWTTCRQDHLRPVFQSKDLQDACVVTLDSETPSGPASSPGFGPFPHRRQQGAEDDRVEVHGLTLGTGQPLHHLRR